MHYEARNWICKGSKVRKWWLVADKFGINEKSTKPTPATTQAAPAVTQTDKKPVPPANELPFNITADDLPANEIPLGPITSADPMSVIYDGDDTDTDMDDRINGPSECYEIDDLLNAMDNDTGTAPAATETNPNILLGCRSGTAQTGMTPDGHTFEVDPSDDDLPF